MTHDEIRAGLVDDILRVAPDLAAADITDDARLADDLGLDSMDRLNLVSALCQRFGISIPEVDYHELATPATAVRYIDDATDGR